jgi:hypothetical protein
MADHLSERNDLTLRTMAFIERTTAPGAIFEPAVDSHHGVDATGGPIPDPHRMLQRALPNPATA